MPVRPRKRLVVVQFRPAIPPVLVIYHPGDWGAPAEGAGPEWEAGHRAAYQRWQQAAAEWFDEHKHMPVDPAAAPAGDVPWCGVFDEHDCAGEGCPRQSRVRDL